MPTFTRETWVDAPLEEVWDFHSTIEGLEAVTPRWMNLCVESVYGPDGKPNPGMLTAGSVLRMSARPFGVGPQQTWTSRVTRREEYSGAAMFEDRMVAGPFEHWTHTHQFYTDDGGTLVRDTVEYELPFGPLGRVAGPVAKAALGPMFGHRHRRTRERLE